MSFEDFENDPKTIYAVQHQILVTGEACKRLPMEFREKHPNIPWKQMTGTRDVLIHVYEEADYKIIWNIVTVQLPKILPELKNILKELTQ